MTLEDKATSALRVVPRQPRAAATVQRVMAAALLVLRRAPNPERDGITMEAIAAAAGASVPAVYRYFSSVDAVYAAVVQHEQARVLQQGLTLLAARRPDSAQAVAAVLVDFFIRVFSELIAGNPRSVLFLLRRHHEVGYGAFAAAAPQVQAVLAAAGRPADALHVVTALSSLASAVKAVILTDPAQLREPAFRERAVRIMLGALDAPAAAPGAVEPGAVEPVAWSYDRWPEDGPEN